MPPCCRSVTDGPGRASSSPKMHSSVSTPMPRSDRSGEPLDEVERRLGNLAPAMVDREGVAPVSDLHNLRHGGIASLPLVGGVRHRPWHRVVLLTFDDQKGPTV